MLFGGFAGRGRGRGWGRGRGRGRNPISDGPRSDGPAQAAA